MSRHDDIIRSRDARRREMSARRWEFEKVKYHGSDSDLKTAVMKVLPATETVNSHVIRDNLENKLNIHITPQKLSNILRELYREGKIERQGHCFHSESWSTWKRKLLKEII
jgi:hypothetical protein